MNTIPHLSSEPWFTLTGSVEPPHVFGSERGFERRCVPIPPGGQLAGRIAGVGLGGTDWQTVWPDGTTELEAHYALRTDRDELLEVVSTGIRSGPEHVMRALLRGERVDPSEIYFRGLMRITADSPRLHEYTRRLFVTTGRRAPDSIVVEAYAVE